MISVSVSQIIKAPREAVTALYADYQNWDKLFPLIKGVRFVGQEGDRTILEIDHEEGRVPNVLRKVSAETYQLREEKQKYSATFWNKFEAVQGGTRYTVKAEIRLRGLYRLLEFFVGGLVRTRIQQYVIEPLKAKAEANLNQAI